MHEVNLLPFRHELVHVFGKVITRQGMAIRVGDELIGKTHSSGKNICNIDTVIVKIGGKVDVGVHGHEFPNEFQEPSIYQASFAVLFFGPGIGAVDVNGREQAFRDMLIDELPCLDPQHPNVRQTKAVDAAAGLPAPLVIKIDCDKIPFEFIRGRFCDEVADPAADLQGYGLMVFEYSAPIGRIWQFLGADKTGRFYMYEGLAQGLLGRQDC